MAVTHLIHTEAAISGYQSFFLDWYWEWGGTIIEILFVNVYLNLCVHDQTCVCKNHLYVYSDLQGETNLRAKISDSVHRSVSAHTSMTVQTHLKFRGHIYFLYLLFDIYLLFSKTQPQTGTMSQISSWCPTLNPYQCVMMRVEGTQYCHFPVGGWTLAAIQSILTAAAAFNTSLFSIYYMLEWSV